MFALLDSPTERDTDSIGSNLLRVLVEECQRRNVDSPLVHNAAGMSTLDNVTEECPPGVVTMNSRSFREYAILDSLQILSNNGSMYLGTGTGAAAASYFAQMGRKPRC